jgi:group I intron endonuclease
MIIYKATNLINGKVYIGKSTKSLETRKKEHFIEATTMQGTAYFHKAIRKHGRESFEFEILLERNDITGEELNKYEMYYISKYKSFGKNGYNLTKGGEGMIGYHHTDKTKALMSSNRKGRKTWNKGIPCEDEVKEKISNSLKGNVPWNKGLKTGKPAWNSNKTLEELFGTNKATDIKKRCSEKLKGHMPWNAGKKLSLKHRKKLSDSHKGLISHWIGRHHSDATKKLISKNRKGKNKGQVAWNKGITLSEEARKKIGEASKKSWERRKEKMQQMKVAI